MPTSKFFNVFFDYTACRIVNVSGVWLDIYISKKQQQRMENKMFGITKKDNWYYTGMFYKNSTTQIGHKTYMKAVWYVISGRSI